MENTNAVNSAITGWFDDYPTLAAKYGEATLDAIERDAVAAARTGICGSAPEVFDAARLAAHFALLATR